MALAVGVLYWWVHGAAEWFWQMPGVTIPMLLLLALGVAETDAHASALVAQQRDIPTEPAAVGTLARDSAESAQPRGRVFRTLVIVATLSTFVALALPYLSLRFLDLSIANLGVADPTALSQTAVAARLRPTSAEPFSQRAEIYEDAARQTAGGIAGDAGTAELDDLALALVAREDAITRDPAAWALHYQAGMAAWNLAQRLEQFGTGKMPKAASSAASLAATAEDRAAVARIRALDSSELRQRARSHLEQARDRNPLNPLVLDMLAKLG